ncbi:hypothetical protein [Nonomuraea mesophila]|nr:hypothetical protein [Nonomuraea mesophila]
MSHQHALRVSLRADGGGHPVLPRLAVAVNAVATLLRRAEGAR